MAQSSFQQESILSEIYLCLAVQAIKCTKLFDLNFYNLHYPFLLIFQCNLLLQFMQFLSQLAQLQSKNIGQLKQMYY